LKHSETTTKQQLRAYISIEAKGTANFNPATKVLAHVRFHNTGQIFARNVRSFIDIKISHDPHEKKFPIDEGRVYGTNVIAPRATLITGTPAILKSEITDEMKGNEATYLYVWGVVRYHDGFKDGRFTKFCHRYNCRAKSSRAGKYTFGEGDARYHHNGAGIDEDEEQGGP
jgi:hypothetical protein